MGKEYKGGGCGGDAAVKEKGRVRNQGKGIGGSGRNGLGQAETGMPLRIRQALRERMGGSAWEPLITQTQHCMVGVQI